MSSLYTIEDLESWDGKIRDKAREFGLDCYPQQFEICDHNQMLSSMAYSGVPSRYPHWSYGKTYEKQKTLYDYGVSGLPYELVINSNPVLAYLMRDNYAASSDSHDRACLRPQRFFQKQLYLQDHEAGVHHRYVQSPR